MSGIPNGKPSIEEKEFYSEHSKEFHRDHDPEHSAAVTDGDLHAVSAHGAVATDEYGQPLIHFDKEAEKRLVRKLDMYTVPTVSLLYLFCFIDRTNIGNARLAGFENSLHLQGVQFNAILSVFYVSYILFEIPSNILCKHFGPGKWLPLMTLCFGLLSMCTAFVTTYSNTCAVRFLLGIFEAGLLPGIAYYLSRWYRKHELAFRVSLYIAMAPLGGAFSGLLASGILKINGIGKVHTWQQLFLVEGLITIGLAVISYFTLTDRPETARWLTAEERELAIARIKSENVGSTEVLDKMKFSKLKVGILNPDTIVVGLIFLLDNITAQSLAFFLPTIVGTIYPDATVVSKQLHTVPPFVVGAASVVIINFLTWRTGKLLLFYLICAPLPIIGYAMFVGSTNPHVRYGATFVIAIGTFPFGALCCSQASANTLSDSARSTGIGFVMVLGNVGGLIATWAFPKYDSPNYYIGNSINLATNSLLLLLSVGLVLWLKYDNRRRDKADMGAALAAIGDTPAEQLDWKHPAFRWRY